jgi:hypothetical protein
MFTSAAARLTMPSARTIDLGCFSQPILKLPSERCACAPQYLSAATSTGPKLSVSTRTRPAFAGLIAVISMAPRAQWCAHVRLP